MNQTQDITKLSIGELKILAFDERQKFDICQQNLNVLYAEIQKYQQASSVPEVKAD